MDIFKTKDIYETAALIAAKARFLNLEKDKGFYWFVFENATACRNISDSYFRNELTVLGKDYADACKTLKDLVHSNR